MLKPWPKNSASPSTSAGLMSFSKISRWWWSGASSMIRSASSAASAGVTTRRPSASAFSRLADPSRSPTRTSTPESRRESACACPWLPYPMIATCRPWITLRSAASS